MQSFRILGRALPRAAPRFTIRSSRSVSSRAIQTPLRPSAAIQIPRYPASAAFSTSRAQNDSIGQQVAVKLADEIALETGEDQAESTDSTKNVQNFLNENDFWTLVSRKGEQEVVMTRKYEDEDITVAFSIADFNTSSMLADEAEADEAYMDEAEDLEPAGPKGTVAVNQGSGPRGGIKVAPEDGVAPADQEGIEEEDDYPSQEAFPVNVAVLIQRPGKGALRASLMAESGQWTINSVTHLSEEVAGSQSAGALIRPTPDSPVWAGPPFSQLDEDLQGLMEQYFEQRGIDAGLALFIPDYTDVKEQTEYLEWLENVKNFVE